jgi:hypothetical protein
VADSIKQARVTHLATSQRPGKYAAMLRSSAFSSIIMDGSAIEVLRQQTETMRLHLPVDVM